MTTEEALRDCEESAIAMPQSYRLLAAEVRRLREQIDTDTKAARQLYDSANTWRGKASNLADESRLLREVNALNCQHNAEMSVQLGKQRDEIERLRAFTPATVRDELDTLAAGYGYSALWANMRKWLDEQEGK